MDWFERLTGFRETSYDDTRAKLELDGARLKSLVNGRSYCIGELELVSLAALRERTRTGEGPSGRLRVDVAIGDVREMHRLPENAGALFQVASQFNLLEMVSPSVTPEQGVTRYQNDRTQGPACAIACGAATIYRNYFAPVGGSTGQTALRQLDGLAGIGKMPHDRRNFVIGLKATGDCMTAKSSDAGTNRFSARTSKIVRDQTTDSSKKRRNVTHKSPIGWSTLRTLVL